MLARTTAFTFVALIWGTSLAIGQVVQLPTSGTFNISTSVAAPDRGSVSMGGIGGSRSGTVSRGIGPGQVAAGRTTGGTLASLRTTVIDLDELDRMIRSQNGKLPGDAQLHSTDPREHIRIQTAAKGRIDTPDYAYMAVLSGHSEILKKGDPDSVVYYLALAERARSRGNWASVELYYRLAWENLPADKQQAALDDLAKARNLEKKQQAGAALKPPPKR